MTASLTLAGPHQVVLGLLCLGLCQWAVALHPSTAGATMEDPPGHVPLAAGASASYQTAELRFEPRSGGLGTWSWDSVLGSSYRPSCLQTL